MNLSERLKAERERIGYSQTAFTELVGASKHTQINWEKALLRLRQMRCHGSDDKGLDVLYVVAR